MSALRNNTDATFTPHELTMARLELEGWYAEANEEVRQATAASINIGSVLLRAKSVANQQGMAVRCSRCGRVFFPVPCQHDPTLAHCPNGSCGEPVELDAVAGGDVAPREDTSIEGVG